MRNKNTALNASPRESFQATLTEGPIGVALFKMTLPMIWGLLAMMAFNLVDTFWVARIGTIPLAAMGFTFPVVLTVGHLAMGMGIGASSVISRAIGEGDPRKVQRLTTDSLTLSFLVVGVGLIAGSLTIDPLFTSMGADRETLAYIRAYMQIWYAGIIFLVVPMVGNHAIRASGDTFSPGMIMVFGSVANMILDPLLIFGWLGFPAMGIRGAALATVMSRALTMILSLWILSRKKNMLSFARPEIQDVLESWRKILHIGIPSSGAMVIPTVCLGILTWMVADFGQKAVAGFGVAGKVEGFALVIFIAVSTVFSPFVGQNWGARQYSRVRKALTKTINFSLLLGFVQAVLLYVLAEPIARVFNSDSDVLFFTVRYLRIIPIGYGVVSVVFLITSAFNALGRPLPAVMLMAGRLLCLQVPLAYFGKTVFGYTGFLLATHVASVTTALWGLWWIRNTCREAALRSA